MRPASLSILLLVSLLAVLVGSPAAAEEPADSLLKRLLPALDGGQAEPALVERLQGAALRAARDCAQPACDPGLSGDGLAVLQDLHPFEEVRFHWRARVEVAGEKRPALVAWYQIEGRHVGGLASGPNGLLLGRVVIPIAGFERIADSSGESVNVPRLVTTSAVLHRLDHGAWREIPNPWTQVRRDEAPKPRRGSDFCDASCSFGGGSGLQEHRP